MRAKVIIPVLGLAMFVLSAVLVWHVGNPPPENAAQPPTLAAPSHEAVPSSSGLSTVSHHEAVELTANSSNQSDDDSNALELLRLKSTLDQQARLAYLARTGDAKALDTILSNLSNPDADIRRAALAAAVDFGDRRAIPALNAALEASSDPVDEANIQKAINFLQLPTIGEQDSGVSDLTGVTGPP